MLIGIAPIVLSLFRRRPAQLHATLCLMALGVYVHVPWCASRCGYCDFNTYIAEPEGFLAAARAEIELVCDRPATTVFFGGGTPTLLPPSELAAVLHAIPRGPGTEATVEANPESVDERSLAALRAAGFTRISLGMQSAAASVLEVLDRRHTPGRATDAALWARQAGFEHVSLDLIFGTPGETDDDWRASLDAVIAAATDHVSTYPLDIEPGTRMHSQIARGLLPAPDPDAQARRYELADRLLRRGGLRLVRGLQLGARPGGALPPQHRLLGERRLDRDRTRRALPSRRPARMERQTPGGLVGASARRRLG